MHEINHSALKRGGANIVSQNVEIFMKKVYLNYSIQCYAGFLLNSSQDMEMSKKSRSNLTRQMLPLETIQRKLDMSIKLWYRAGAKKFQISGVGPLIP